MAQQFSNGYALLIAVDENAVSEWALPDVAKDVAALEAVLIHPERCAYPRENVKVLKGKDSSRTSILEQLEWLEDSIKADASGNATAIVYYTGHGWRDESAEPDEFYFIPYDVREDKIRSRALRAADFADAIEALNPRRLLVVLDCCHAGGMGVKEVRPTPAGYAQAAFEPVKLMAGEKAPAGPGAKGLEALAAGRGRAVLSSSTGEQSSYMRPDGTMSIFTYHLIEALTGHARPEEGATDVLVSDAMGYVYRHVPRSAKQAWDKDQEPDFQVSGNFPIALLLGGKGWSKGLEAPDPLAKLPEAEGERVMRRIDTGGGAYIRGGVEIRGGDFVGRDKIVHGDEIRGDVYSGDFRGAILNVRSTLKDVSQSIDNVTGADPSTKKDLEELVAQLAAALEQVPPERAEDAEAVATLTESMVAQATAEQPNKSLLQITGEGLKKAAENIADVLPAVLDIATKMVAVIGGLGLL